MNDIHPDTMDDGNNNNDNNQTITTTTGTIAPAIAKVSPAAKNTLLTLNIILLFVGNCGGPLIMRLYFLHGGTRVWLSAGLETAGFPFIMIVLIILYFLRRGKNGNVSTPKFMHIRTPLFIAVAVIGVLSGFDGYLYAYGVARLPVSTSSLIVASQLVFTAFFSFICVKQKFTQHSINAVVLLSVGAGVLALHTSGDRPAGESNKMYVMGFVMTVAAAALYGFILPLTELTYNKARQAITYTLVLEIQMVIGLFATIFCTIGMIVNNDFKVIPREAREFELGKAEYYLILCASALIWQCATLGAIGVIFCASSLLSGILIVGLIPVTEVLAVLIYKEKFQAEKGVALILSVWGLAFYSYGEYKFNKKLKSKTISQRSSEVGHADV